MRVLNNSRQVSSQLERLNVGRVWEDDGSVGVEVEDSRLNEVVSLLQSLNLPSSVGDGFQEGCVWVSNESGSVNQELSDF